MSETTVKPSLNEQKRHGVAEISRDAMLAFGGALLTIVGGDGEVSEREWAFFETRARGMGAPESAILAWKKFDVKPGNLQEFLAEAFRGNVAQQKTKRVLLYDAVSMASADGDYAAGERAMAARAAKILGVEPAVLAAIEGIVELENTLARARIALFDAP